MARHDVVLSPPGSAPFRDLLATMTESIPLSASETLPHGKAIRAFIQSVLRGARMFCASNRAAMGMTKRSMKLGSGLALERELQQGLFQSDGPTEGFAAVQNKCKPESKEI